MFLVLYRLSFLRVPVFWCFFGVALAFFGVGYLLFGDFEAETKRENPLKK